MKDQRLVGKSGFATGALAVGAINHREVATEG